MTIKIPDTIFDGLVKWMGRGPWPEYFQEAIDDHLHAYCDQYNLDTFDELAENVISVSLLLEDFYAYFKRF